MVKATRRAPVRLRGGVGFALRQSWRRRGGERTGEKRALILIMFLGGFFFSSLFLIYTIKNPPPLWHPVGRRSLTEVEARGDGGLGKGMRPGVTPGSFGRKKAPKNVRIPPKKTSGARGEGRGVSLAKREGSPVSRLGVAITPSHTPHTLLC